MKIDEPGLEYTVAPLKAPSNIRMGVRTKRGPISTKLVCGGPLGCKGSFSMIWDKDINKRILKSMRRAYLIVTEPDFVIQDGEGENVVNERLCFASRWGNTKYLRVN